MYFVILMFYNVAKHILPFFQMYNSRLRYRVCTHHIGLELEIDLKYLYLQSDYSFYPTPYLALALPTYFFFSLYYLCV